MAIMHFLQGTYSGKLGETVGAGWKGQRTTRTMPISVHDAKSSSQINVRNCFAIISKISSAINTVWLKKYFGDVKKMSAYNVLLKNNKTLFTTSPIDPSVVQFPQSYLGSPTPPSVTPTISDATVSLSMPPAATLSQGTVTEYVVAAFVPTETTDSDGNTRISGHCVSTVVAADSSAVAVTLTLPVTPATGDKVYVYSQAGDGKRVNYSSVATITVS